MATTLGVPSGEGTGPYHVGRMRAKLALRAALATEDQSVQHRRLKSVLERNALNNDVGCYEWRMGGQYYKDLCTQIFGPAYDPRFADMDMQEEDDSAVQQPPAGEPQQAAEQEMPADEEDAIYSMVPGLGAEDYPGFPSDSCPAELPDLSKHYSLLVSLLQEQPDIYARLRDKSTSLGVSFAKCMKAGMDIQGHPMVKTAGLFAGDVECFSLFAEAFDPIIAQMHKGVEEHVSSLDVDGVSDAVIDPEGTCLLGVQVQFRRNLQQYPFPVAMSMDQRYEVEEALASTLASALGGEYAPLNAMTEEVANKMNNFNVIFDAPESNLLRSAGFGLDWPHGRGFFAATSGDLYALVNNEEHLQFAVVRQDSNLKAAFASAAENLALVEKQMEVGFASSPKYGFLPTSLEHLGSGLQADVLLRLPKLGETEGFRSLGKRLKLVVKREPDMGENVWRIGNSEHLGVTEVQQMNAVIEGAVALVEVEGKLAKGEEVDLSSA
mmetsp:Transcript_26406/g.48281  ORF Transcript_26406/g.48281 Transcript_26406/m.48281 type:complete len:494 (-) Transcript_26406:54-1535(-)